MTLSAKRLGERCGLTAEEMNILLKDSTTGKLVIGALALVGYGIYKVITHIKKNDD